MPQTPHTMRTYGWYALEITARARDHTDPPLTLEDIDRHQLAEQLRETADMLIEE